MSLLHELVNDAVPGDRNAEVEKQHLLQYFQGSEEDDGMNSSDFYDFYIELERVVEDELASLDFLNSFPDELESDYLESLEDNAEEQIICPVCR